MADIYREAWAVRDLPTKEGDQDGKSRWTRIGVTFSNRDGSETVVFDALPVNGKLVLRDVKKGAPADDETIEAA